MIVVCCVGLVSIALLFVCYYLPFYQRRHKTENHYRLPKSKHFEHNRDKMYALISEMEQTPYERVYTTSFDGLKLSARYYFVSEGAPLQIQVPGYRGTSVRDFCGGNKLARESGFNTLLIDLRAHGESEGHTITFGIRERFDVVSWINYALERFGKDTQIWLVGVSMGASTVLSASELDLPKNVRGIIADSPYAAPSEIIADSCAKLGLSTKIMTPLINAAAKIFGGFDPDEATALKAVANTDLPILLIHGEEDDIVPCDMSRKLYAACKDHAKLLTFPDAGHGLSYMTDKPRYENAVREFTQETALR